MKKFIIRDEDKEYEVEEVETDVDETQKDEEPASPASLSEDELAALKKLASISDKLIALVKIEKDEHANEPESEMLDEDEDEEETLEDEDKDENEEIVDTDEELDKVKGQDSKKSVGAIARKTKNKDSIADAHEIDVAKAWSKRYGGK